VTQGGFQIDEPDQVGGIRLNPQAVKNHLVIVWAINYIPHSPTKYSKPDVPSDVIVVDVVDLDQVDPDSGQPGLVARNSWWRQARLIQMLKPKIGNRNPVLLKITQGTGANAAYVGESQTSDPMAMARCNQWFQRNPDFKPSTPLAPRTPLDQEVADVATFHQSPATAPEPATTLPESPLERAAREAQEGNTSVVISRLTQMAKEGAERMQNLDYRGGPPPF
jgi:hypothetical protein